MKRFLQFQDFSKNIVSPLSAGRAARLALKNLPFEPPYDKTNKMSCAPSEDSDQPGHPPSLTSLRCPYEETFGPWIPNERTTKTLIRLGGCPG